MVYTSLYRGHLCRQTRRRLLCRNKLSTILREDVA